MKRTKSFICPTTNSRDHDNRGAYCTINQKTGKVYLGCYCNEGRSVPIGTYKKGLAPLEKGISEKVEGDCTRLESESAFERSESAFDTSVVKLDNIRPNEVINQNNIGSYLPRLEKADVVCMRSCMMTFKTQNLKELMDTYKRVLIVSFRVSLEDEYMETFKDHDFKLYSDFKGVITGDRIIVQIDSLYKVRGEFDLLVLDEIVYTMDHMHSFVKRKPQVWEALNQYISDTQKIIACDALLDNKTINLFKKSGRSTLIVENKWKSFNGKKFKYNDFVDFPSTVKYILDNIKQWGSLYIPTNSKTFADKIFYYLREQGLRVGLDSSETEPTPSDEWKQYELFITTPTNVAGVSCNDEFGKTICYFTSMSCSASMCAQMIFRVRNTKSDTYDIFVKNGTNGLNFPIRTNDIKSWINDKDDLVLKSGLKINHIRNKIIEDDYYKNYIEYIKKENLSKVMFKQVLRGILQVHGLDEIKDEEKDEQPSSEEILKEMKELEEIKNTSKELHEKEKKISRENVCEALSITDDQFKIIDEKYRKTKDEKLSLRRYHLEKTYGTDIKLTEEFVKTYEKIMPQYKNLQTMKCSKSLLHNYIETMINQHEKEHLRDDNTQRLHEKRHLLKIWTAHNLVTMLGFDNIYDTRTIKGYPYEKAQKFLIEHGDNIGLLFGCKNDNKWKNMKELTQERKKIISKYITDKLKSVCHISVSNKHRGKGREKEEYTIQGLDIWKKGGLTIPKNEYAERLYVEKNFKRIMNKTRVGTNMWKCISELVEVKE